MNPYSEQQSDLEASPPFFLRSWRLLYGLVLGELAVLVLLFFLFMQAFE